jgi:hypothetical protein
MSGRMSEDATRERKKRLGEALRMNLKRRKAQQRARSAGTSEEPPREGEARKEGE